ncbi:MAG: helix-turn-helix transcriptional regulator [Sandaracinaceae bacterium]|nr:helix-turn-helix transcriptional regulator [Sandaracinaceae bacterium]
MSSPTGRFVAGDSFAHGFLCPDLRVLLLWGRPEPPDIRRMIRAIDSELLPSSSRHAALTDARRLTGVDGESFAILSAYLNAHNDALALNTSAHAVVRPDGVAGAVVAGFYSSTVADRGATAIFTSLLDAVIWLGRKDVEEVIDAVGGLHARLTGDAPILIALRELLSKQHVDLTVSGAARRIGVSERTLQHHLKLEGTSFRKERSRARITAAKDLLESTDTKLSAIALMIGCSSLQHFSTMFRRATGTTPASSAPHVGRHPGWRMSGPSTRSPIRGALARSW